MTSKALDAETGASDPELLTADQATTAVIRGVIPTVELPNFFDNSFRTLPEVISAQKVAIVTPPRSASTTGLPARQSTLKSASSPILPSNRRATSSSVRCLADALPGWFTTAHSTGLDPRGNGCGHGWASRD